MTDYNNYVREYSTRENDRSKLHSYISWVEEELQYLQQLSEMVREVVGKDISFEVELEAFTAYKNYFRQELKPALNRLTKDIANKILDVTNIEKFEKVLQMIKKPFNEVKGYSNHDSFKNAKLIEWFRALAEALEGSTHKLIKFVNKVGYRFER